MKHRLLTTLMASILCLGWCMSANAQKKFFIKSEVLNGSTYETKYLGMSSATAFSWNTNYSDAQVWTVQRCTDYSGTSGNKTQSVTYNFGYRIYSNYDGSNYQIGYGNSGSFADHSAFTLLEAELDDDNDGANKSIFIFSANRGTNQLTGTLAEGVVNESESKEYCLFRSDESGSKKAIIANPLITGSNNYVALNKSYPSVPDGDGSSTGLFGKTGATFTLNLFSGTTARSTFGQDTFEDQINSIEQFIFTFVPAVDYYGEITLTRTRANVTIDGGASNPSTYSFTATLPYDVTSPTKTVTLKATPAYTGDTFLGWFKDNVLVSDQETFDYTFSVTSTTQASPTSVSLEARYAAPKPIFVDGTGYDSFAAYYTSFGKPTLKDDITSIIVREADATTQDITYVRKFSSDSWQAWFTPVAFELDADLNKDFRFAKIGGAFADEDSKYISFVSLLPGDMILPNVPYIVKRLNNITTAQEILLPNATLAKTDTETKILSIKSAEQKFTFKGQYADKKVSKGTRADWYTLNTSGSFVRPDARESENDITINAFRFIMEVEGLENNPYGESPAEVRVRVTTSDADDPLIDDATVIYVPKAKSEKQDGAYDLTGRRMSKEGMLRRGQIFIMNGKKYWNR